MAYQSRCHLAAISFPNPVLSKGEGSVWERDGKIFDGLTLVEKQNAVRKIFSEPHFQNSQRAR
jgi:hypothetical protein